MRDSYKVAMAGMFDPAMPLVYVKTLKEGSTTSENKDLFAMYGYAKSTAADGVKGKRLAIMVNTTNGSMAGVNQILTGAKPVGSLINDVDGKEYELDIALQSAANMKLNKDFAPTGSSLVTDAVGENALSTPVVGVNYNWPASTVAAPTTNMLILPFKASAASHATGWGMDANKLVNIAFTDVRPSEAVPGQIANKGKWDSVKFPFVQIAMQGFQVAVNANLYNALVTRDIAEGRLASACAGVTSAACQPTIFSAEMTSLMMGKRPAGWNAATPVTLQRRVDSSGTQAASQIFFATTPNPALVKTQSAFASVLGATLSDAGTVAGPDSGVNIVVNSSSDNVAAKIPLDTTGYSVGVLSSDKGAYTTASKNILSVKIDGFSPNVYDNSGVVTSDSSAKATLAKGYPFQFEFGAIIPTAANKAPQAAVAAMFKEALILKTNNVKGVVYNGTDAGQSAYSRGGNNFAPLSQYVAK
ncbi:hypothetical protein [Limnohabitans sp.]|uniref:hypothetical protein n=1 Tax=Limnohabitans sp. TaxID=1907725 RepID=UPI0038BBF7B5